jgi:predicted enzyme related to lactoylglutathione lyase
MARVLGIGGFFFRATDPIALAEWYETHFGINRVPDDYTSPVWQQEGGDTVFAPFPRDTDYFKRAEQQWMINFRVDDLDGMVAALRSKGVEVELFDDPEPNGRFAHLLDPEGNPIELWEPA